MGVKRFVMVPSPRIPAPRPPQALLLSGLAAIEKNPSAMVDASNREAAHAMKLKALDL
jgi:hypothetical protein